MSMILKGLNTNSTEDLDKEISPKLTSFGSQVKQYYLKVTDANTESDHSWSAVSNGKKWQGTDYIG